MDRPIHSLRIEELEGIAWAAVSGWQAARVKAAAGDRSKIKDLIEA